MHVWTLAARDGAVLRKKQDRLDAPLQGPVLCKRGHAYAFARDSYWLCRMPLSGAHLRPSGACAVSCADADPELASEPLRPERCKELYRAHEPWNTLIQVAHCGSDTVRSCSGPLPEAKEGVALPAAGMRMLLLRRCP